MTQFLELLPPEQALDLFFSRLPGSSVDIEEVNVLDALGRVTASPIYALEKSPSFPRSTMDGYAVRASDTYGATESLPIYLQLIGEVAMGSETTKRIHSTEAMIIHTGGMLPNGADAVIMLENTQESRDNEVEVLKSIAVNDNMIHAGEDVDVGELIIPHGVQIGPKEIGGCLAQGIMTIEVSQQPRVGIISTGDEVVTPENNPVPGQVRDINSYTLHSLIRKFVGIPVFFGIVPDRIDEIRKVTRNALDSCDLVVITAGSSASVRDMTATMIQELGEPGVIVHGINVRPGKPTILGLCGDTPVIGLPGNPVSALLIANLFVGPVIRHLSGEIDKKLKPSIRAKLSINVSSQSGREEWVPVQIFQGGNEIIAEPIFYKSNLIFNLIKADGLVKIPETVTGMMVGDIVDVFIFNNCKSI